jgi:hypothetical protein
MAQTSIPAAAEAFFKETERISAGIKDLLDAERRRAEEIQRAVKTLQGQLQTADESRQLLIELTTSAQRVLINSQNQLGGLVGAVESLLAGNGEPEEAAKAAPPASDKAAAAAAPSASQGSSGQR